MPSVPMKGSTYAVRLTFWSLVAEVTFPVSPDVSGLLAVVAVASDLLAFPAFEMPFLPRCESPQPARVSTAAIVQMISLLMVSVRMLPRLQS